MPDGPYPTPDESGFLRMLQEGGSPEQAGMNLVQRLLALEAAVADLEARMQHEDAGPDAADQPAPDAGPEPHSPTA